MTWYSFVTVSGGWSQHEKQSAAPARPFGHLRSLSSLARASTPIITSPNYGRQRSPSLHEEYSTAMSTQTASPALHGPPQTPGLLSSSSFMTDSEMSTLPDPRSRAMRPSLAPGSSAHAMSSPRTHHPDLDEEVATLSTKLINAINHQTTLDDTLSAAKAELEDARDTIQRLEARLAEQREMLSGDVWVRRKSVEAEKAKLLGRVAEEKRARQEVEQQKKRIELELENLTAALFEEANKMVISAKEESRREQDAVQRKNDLLRAQLADTEGLLKSQQDQLAELKVVMEQMSADRDDFTAPTAPSSPGFSKFDPSSADDAALSEGASQAGGLLEPVSPSCPTSFTHLLQPVLRTDLASYEDFMNLVRTTKRLSAAARSRPLSGSHTGGAMSALGLSLGGATVSPAASPSMTPVSSSGSLPQTPNTPGSSLGTGSAGGQPQPPIVLPPLKDTKFYKRALAEDIEPTLRLDIAPGLSWLARRAVVNAMTDGSLVVEPVPAATPGSLAAITKPQFFPCALCGESRREDEHLRTHRFRTSESDSAQRYPLCKSYCLVRVRAVCDFLGFLRMLKDGHWRADDEDAERAAWEESVRLREQMFWARIGGGVVPASSVGAHRPHSPHVGAVAAGRTSRDSPRTSHESRRKAGEAGSPIKMDSSSRSSDKIATSSEQQAQLLPSPPPASTSEHFPPGAKPEAKTWPATPPAFVANVSSPRSADDEPEQRSLQVTAVPTATSALGTATATSPRDDDLNRDESPDARGH